MAELDKLDALKTRPNTTLKKAPGQVVNSEHNRTP